MLGGNWVLLTYLRRRCSGLENDDGEIITKLRRHQTANVSDRANDVAAQTLNLPGHHIGFFV